MTDPDGTPILDASTLILSGLPASPEDYQEALRNADTTTWSAREALCWLKGRNPAWFRGDIFAVFPREADQIRRAVKAGVLDAEGSTPREWFRFASQMGGWLTAPELAPILAASKQQPQPAPKKRCGRPRSKWTVELVVLYDKAESQWGQPVTLEHLVTMAERENSQWIATRVPLSRNKLFIREDNGAQTERVLKELNRVLKKCGRMALCVKKRVTKNQQAN